MAGFAPPPMPPSSSVYPTPSTCGYAPHTTTSAPALGLGVQGTSSTIDAPGLLLVSEVEEEQHGQQQQGGQQRGQGGKGGEAGSPPHVGTARGVGIPPTGESRRWDTPTTVGLALWG